MQDKLVSIIIPTKNRSGFILRSIKSLIAQTYKKIEIIVVDDNSTDDTCSVINQFSEQYGSDIKYFCLSGKSGAQAARNLGIRNASGEWIAFQDSDDEWLPRKLELQMNALEKRGYDPFTVVHTESFINYVDSGIMKKWERPVIEGDNIYSFILTSSPPLFPTILTSKIALEKIEYLDENVKAHQEWDTSIRLAKICRFIQIKEPLFIYHIHNETTISSDNKKDILAYKFIIDKHKEDIIKYCGIEKWHEHLFKLLSRSLYFKLWNEADYFINELKKEKVTNIKFLLYRALRFFKTDTSVMHLRKNSIK